MATLTNFTQGTKAKSSEVNGNFTNVNDEVELNNTKGNVFFVPSMAYSSIIAGTWTFSVSGNDVVSTLNSVSSPADGDELNYTLFLRAGTYKLQVFGVGGTTTAIQDWYIGASEVASFDWYTPSGTNFREQTGITVSADALYTIRAVLDGRNGSSSSWVSNWYYFILTRTGA